MAGAISWVSFWFMQQGLSDFQRLPNPGHGYRYQNTLPFSHDVLNTTATQNPVYLMMLIDVLLNRHNNTFMGSR